MGSVEETVTVGVVVEGLNEMTCGKIHPLPLGEGRVRVSVFA
jgi:hypothetical protein